MDDNTRILHSLVDVSKRTGLSMRAVRTAVQAYAETAECKKPEGLRAIKIGRKLL